MSVNSAANSLLFRYLIRSGLHKYNFMAHKKAKNKEMLKMNGFLFECYRKCLLSHLWIISNRHFLLEICFMYTAIGTGLALLLEGVRS